MKFKAVTNMEAPQDFIDHLNGLRDLLEYRIGQNCFRIPVGSMGPAEFYVQRTDLAAKQKPFVSYNASGITLKSSRDFQGAVEMIELIIRSAIQEYWPLAGRVQIMVVIHASSADGSKSILFENKAPYFEFKAQR